MLTDHPHDAAYPSDEEHSVLEDDSEEEQVVDYMDDDDGSSSLSIPNESIDFDLVYALHSFAATVEGQAHVVKGDSLFLMDDSNSYWWLVRVLKTQEVGYIPAENIETPFERLARLNKHRNVDLASATFAELQETRDRLRDNLSSRNGSNATPSPSPRPRPAAGSRQARGVSFTASFSVHRYPPAVWGDEEEEDEDVEWDDEGYEDEDPDLVDDQDAREGVLAMEPDDGMSWEDGAVEHAQAAARAPDGPPPQTARQPEQPSVQPLAVQQSPKAATIVLPDPGPPSPGTPRDPAEVTETRKVSITPPVARTPEPRPAQSPASGGPLLPSAIMQQQSDERKRTREEIEALEEAARKKANVGGSAPSSPNQQGKPAQGSRSPAGNKLRKERDTHSLDDESGKDKDKKKKSGSVFGGLFGRKKDKEKGKEKGGESGAVRESEESGRSTKDSIGTDSSSFDTSRKSHGSQPSFGSVTGIDASPQAQEDAQRLSQESTPTAAYPQLSQHVSQLRQRDQQQQALYQQYLNRSPSTPPEAQPSYGLQSASAVLSGMLPLASAASSGSIPSTPSRARPASLVLSPAAMDAQSIAVPELSVIRVFAGNNVQTEATFKTVLLNSSTTAAGLVRQAIQRFRLPAGDDENSYYLTIKQVEGSSARLLPDEKPLGVFESLVEAAMELPKVKRSSVGSISSIASNLSMHPAIRSLSMNDFTDDSAVKFYLNRKGDRGDSMLGEEGEDTLLAESPEEENMESPRSRPQYLTVSSSNAGGVTPERFSSPSYRFALQLVIHSDDLPDDMAFDNLTEAIVFKSTLRDRPQVNIVPSPGISQTERKKIFMFPKNVTVAEIIEQGLERFGILEGVVDGGDEIEDKLTKRRSSTRVRYGLWVQVDGRDTRELPPTSKVTDAYPRPPTFRPAERRSADSKRRSIDSMQLLLGAPEDVPAGDPVFILRRSTSYRPSGRHRMSAPLDELALQQLHRESTASSSAGSDSTAGPSEEVKQQQMSKQAIIAAQRAASRDKQRAILSAQANSARGLDVLLPGNAMIRSSRYDVGDRIRYSYVEPDGQAIDISDIVEQEWRGELGPGSRSNNSGGDLLHGVLSRGKDGLGAKLDRVLSKIKHERGTARTVARSTTAGTIDTMSSMQSGSSVYSSAEGGEATSTSRAAVESSSPVAQRVLSPVSRLSSYRTASPGESDGRSGARSTTPTATYARSVMPPHERQASALSEVSVYRTATPSSPPGTTPRATPTPKLSRPALTLPDDDLGITNMLAIIELKARQKIPEEPPLDPVDELLFGRPIDLNALHPDIKNIYHTSFKQLEEMDEVLDNLLQCAGHAIN